VVADDLFVVLHAREVQHLHCETCLLQDGGDLQDAERHEHALVQQENGRGGDQADSLGHTLLMHYPGNTPAPSWGSIIHSFLWRKLEIFR